MSTDARLLYAQVDHVVTLTLNRPDCRNAPAGDDMFLAFEQTVERINSDLTVRAAIVMRWTKRLPCEADAASLDSVLEAGSTIQAMAHHTNDHAEALTAFFERRPAQCAGT